MILSSAIYCAGRVSSINNIRELIRDFSARGESWQNPNRGTPKLWIFQNKHPSTRQPFHRPFKMAENTQYCRGCKNTLRDPSDRQLRQCSNCRGKVSTPPGLDCKQAKNNTAPKPSLSRNTAAPARQLRQCSNCRGKVRMHCSALDSS
jgi:hypothetical protein